MADLTGVDDLGAVAAGHTTSNAMKVSAEVGSRALASACGGGGLAGGGASAGGVVAGITASSADLVAARVPGRETTAALIDHSVALDENVGFDVSSVGDGAAGGVLAATAAGVLVSEIDADSALLTAGGARVSAGHVTVRVIRVLMLEGQISIRSVRQSLVVGHGVLLRLVVLGLISLQVSGDGFQRFARLEHVHVFGVNGVAILLVDSEGFTGVLAVRDGRGDGADEKDNSHLI
jgi:hypothetical protein